MDVEPMEVDSELGAYSEFLAAYPGYKETMIIDSIRHEEYPHLDNRGQICFDYNGVGLFSGTQIGKIGIEFTHIQSNLATHAMYSEEGSTENFFRKRVLQYLNLDENNYYIVFTANALCAFKLLGTSYPFHTEQNLLLAYDHKCENVDSLRDCALAKSACIQSVALSLPSCKINAVDLKDKLQSKRKVCMKKGGGYNKGLFAFPYSSRVTGCRSSSRWITQAQQNGWHVLLDITSIDAKILDSLGLSFYQPEFIICSFYNIFGEDPTGFGCLAVKRSALRTLGDSSHARAIGMVVIKSKQVPLLIFSEPAVSTDEKVENVYSQSPKTPLEDQNHGSDLLAELTSSERTSFHRSDVSDFTISPASQCELGGNEVVYADSERQHYGVGAAEPSSHLFTDTATIKHRKSARGGLAEVHKGGTSSSFSGWVAHEVSPTGSWRSTSDRYFDDEGFLFPTEHQNEAGVSSFWQSHMSEISESGTSPVEDNALIKTEGQISGQSSMQSMEGDRLTMGGGGDTHSKGHMSLKRLFKYETKARLMEHLQKAGQVHSKELLRVQDWMNYYFEKARLRRSSLSSSASTSLRFDVEDAPYMPALLKKSSNTVENEIACKGLDLADMLGYRRIAVRLRCLAHWLISSLARLRHSSPGHLRLVKFYRKMSMADWSSTVALSLCDPYGNAFDLKRVQLLADRSNISIRTGVVEGSFTMEISDRHQNHQDHRFGCIELSSHNCLSDDAIIQIREVPVLYISIGFLNNFSDVYKIWHFICKFLDPLFVEEEFWHYQALNQETIDI
ncbi:hypothetical protein KP509_08G030900 [Ceratopteris richardii]|uniref:Molybdenum cofactor sulfurase n=1 Tax=Ceratopteris richardii TaxID=49495 RepID=A0A8T2UB59_CERRI|nr:hypothetical protein KP509_08G030900 [Ceratopteris richardii]KAH7431127.1 hypothetical protein KP509_08G030900 [Ceratopteris richardii]